MRGAVTALLAVAACAPTAAAQVLPRPTPVQQQQQGRPDSLNRQVAKPSQGAGPAWAPLDSIGLELMKRPGMTTVRYQADTVDYRAADGIMTLIGKKGARSIVEQNQTSLVADTIEFLSKADSVLARGDTIVLRDATKAQDVFALDKLNYDLQKREGTANGVSTAAQVGEIWHVEAHRAAFAAGDSASSEESKFYGKGGVFTSCTDSVRHFHFSAGELKRITNDVVVARNVVLHVMGVPVLWLPFIFQDARSGRRSGILTPRFGLTELVRNSPFYRRTVDNVGYYFAVSDYFDFAIGLDWRSSANATDADPGWTRYNTEFRYNWLDRFASGRIGASLHQMSNGTSNTQISWSHNQDFSINEKLTTNMNLATSTSVVRATALAPVAALATIASQANYQRTLGPVQLSVGGTRRQYPGRDQVDQDYPRVSLTTKPITAGEWFTWSPTVSLNASSSKHLDGQGDFTRRLVTRPDGSVDSVKIDRGTHSFDVSIGTPFKVFDFQVNASVRASDRGNDYPELRTIVDPVDTSKKSVRVFEKTWLSQLDFDLGVNLPQFFGGTWNLVPSISMSNVAPGAFSVRSERTGEKWVSQGKRLSYGLGISPTFYGLYRGFGNVEAIRHSIQTSLSYSFSPKASVSNDYLAALGQTQTGFLGSLQQNRVTLSIQQVFEAKLRTGGDSGSSEQARKIKILSLGLSPLTWDFERGRGPGTGKSKFATDRVDVTLRSDLLPGFDAGAAWSLFQGSVLSDSAVFSPYLESIRAGFQLGSNSRISNLFGFLFGGPQTEAPRDTARQAQQAQQPVRQQNPEGALGTAGRSIRGAPVDLPQNRGFDAQISFSLSQQRPPVGGNVVQYDATLQCAPYKDLNPIAYDTCVRNALNTPPVDVNSNQTTAGGTFFRVPPQMNLQLRTGFALTPNWSASWSTNYDFQRSEFGMQQVALVRDMHDWRANFGFTQSPNGAFTFTFFVALKSEPDIKFDYNRATYGSQSGLIQR